VTPGFVDAHTHLVFAGNRAAEFDERIAGATYQQIAAAGGGILRTVALTRAATEDELLAEARQHRDWMLRAGTTTIEAKSGYGLDHDTELKMLRVMARLNAEVRRRAPAAPKLCPLCWRRTVFRRSLQTGAKSTFAGSQKS
jgi:imidazolonepropionase